MSLERYRIDDLLVDADTGTVTRDGRRLQLPPLSFNLLVALLRRAPDVARRQELLDEVWGGDLVSDETLSQRVRLLRGALADDAERPRYVESVRGWGYRAAMKVQRLEGESPNPTTVAVLPFTNLGGQPDDEPLCQGLAEEIINALAGVEGLRVIARTSSAAASRAGLDVCEAGRRLGAGSIVEGSVRRAGRRVRVTVQLVETRLGGHVWSDSFDRELEDILDLEDQIAEAVARRLRRDLADGQLRRRRRRVDPVAYEAFLEGRHHFHSSAGPEALTLAEASLQRAVTLDPELAPAFDALAELWWYLGFFGLMSPRDAFGQSTWHAMRALELDDSLADTHALLAMLRKELDYNWSEVDREVARARQLDPDSPAVHLRTAVSALLPHGRLDEALAEIDRALEHDPLSIFVRWWSGATAYLARRPERIMAEGKRIFLLEPSNPLGHWVLGLAHECQTDLPSALDHLRQAARLSGQTPFFVGWLALVQAQSGQRDEARTALAALRSARQERYVQPFALALGHIGLGEWDAAFEWMETAVDERDPLAIPLKTYKFLDPVRDDPRLVTLLQAMHLA